MSESTNNKPGATQQNIDTATSHPAASVSQKPCEVRVNVTINKEGKIQNTKIENPQVITDCMKKDDAQGGKRRGRSRRRGKRGGRKSKRRSSKKARKSRKSKRRRGKKSKRRRRK